MVVGGRCCGVAGCCGQGPLTSTPRSPSPAPTRCPNPLGPKPPPPTSLTVVVRCEALRAGRREVRVGADELAEARLERREQPPRAVVPALWLVHLQRAAVVVVQRPQRLGAGLVLAVGRLARAVGVARRVDVAAKEQRRRAARVGRLLALDPRQQGRQRRERRRERAAAGRRLEHARRALPALGKELVGRLSGAQVVGC